MNLDEAFENFLKLEAALNAELQNCENEQQAGRTGIEPYHRARALSKKLTLEAEALSKELEKALASL